MRPKVVLFGDSITEMSFTDGGWGAALANHFARTADVVLRGYSGYNTRWALKVIDKVFAGIGVGEGSGAAASDPVAVTVFFGANDATLPDRSSAFQHVPVPEYRTNLKAIVSFIKERWPTTVILLITPPPIDEDGRLKNPYGDNSSGLSERTNYSAGAYANACISVAAECGLPVLDLWTKMQQIPGWEKTLLSDGLHLTAAGNKIVFEEVVPVLRENGVSTETLPTHLPLFSDIDRDEPMKSFSDL